MMIAKSLAQRFSRACNAEPRSIAVIAACCLMAFTASTPRPALSAESIVPVTPPGSTDVDQAFLPPPGLYGGLVTLPFNQNSSAFDSKGHAVPAAYNAHISLQLYVPLLLYVYPFKLFGGSLGSSFVQPFEHLSYSLGYSPHVSQFGTADAYSDIFYWTKNVGLLGATPGPMPLSYGLSVAGGFALIIPDGGYTTKRALNLGSNAWVLDPNVALTYNTGSKLSFGDNTQLSTRLFYGIPQKNPATHYTSGNIMDVDWSATQQFGALRLGVAGYYQKQLTDDQTGTGVHLPNGNRFTAAGIGPVVEYFIPKWNMFLKAKYTNTFYHKNYVDEQFLVLSAAFKF